MPSLYRFADYSSDWPHAFQRAAKHLKDLLGDALIDIHHIGSTSVPGLAAKPTIDLLPVVQDIAFVDELAAQLEKAGYRAWGEFGLPGRRLLTQDSDGYRTHNVHAYQQGHVDIERHVSFCAYLRSSEAVCREYEAVKRAAYAQHPANIAAYNDAKDPWIKRIEPIALQWYRQHTS